MASNGGGGGGHFLTEGAIEKMVVDKNLRLDKPVVQILSTKQMSNNRLRAVISDGLTSSQHCIFLSESLEDFFISGQLTNFTVIRLDEYSLSELADKNITIIMVPKVSILQNGQRVGRKLHQGESYSEADDDDFDAAVTAASPVKRARVDNPSSAIPAPSTSSRTSNLSQEQLQAAIARHENVCPISVITPFFNAWAIRGLVTAKTALKTYNNAKGPGKLFSFNLLDESGEIRITAFNAEADKFFSLIEDGKSVYINKGNVKAANKKFSTVAHDYELTLSEVSIVEACLPEEESSVPKMRYKFKTLASIESEAVESSVDVIGVIWSVGNVETFTSRRSNKEIVKRELVLVDSSLAKVTLTLFGEKATNLASGTQEGAVLAVRGAKIGDFNGRNLATTFSSVISVSPDLPETTLLASWYRTEGSCATFNSLTRDSSSSPEGQARNRQQFISTISPDLIASLAPNPAYFNITGAICETNNVENHLYKSCSGGGDCQKKVDPDEEGRYRCGKCGHVGSVNAEDGFKWRLMVSLRILDPTGALWVTAFQSVAEKLLGRPAAELARVQLVEGVDAYRRLLKDFKMRVYTCRVGVRIEEYNGERRMRSVAYQIAPVSGAKGGGGEVLKRSRHLLAAIATFEGQLEA